MRSLIALVQTLQVYPRMTDLTLGTTHTPGQLAEVATGKIMPTINDKTRMRWKRRGINPGPACGQPMHPPRAVLYNQGQVV